jgi:chitinase
MYGFDGLSVDWEYPVEGGLVPGAPEDGANYPLLLQAIRAELDAWETIDGKDYELSIAASANPSIAGHMDLPALAASVDWFDLMTYDFHGSWDTITGHHTPLYASPADPSAGAADFNVDAAVGYYMAQGVPAHQIVIGAAFYGRGWEGADATNDGMFQTYSGIPYGTWEPAAFDYSDIAENWERPGTMFWDDDAKAPWIFEASSGTVITYDNPDSVIEKAAYAKANGLGGVMFWELSGDGSGDALLTAIHDGFAR